MNDPEMTDVARVLNLPQLVCLSVVNFFAVLSCAVVLGWGWDVSVVVGSVGGALLTFVCAAGVVLWKEATVPRVGERSQPEDRQKPAQSGPSLRDMVSAWVEDALDDTWDAQSRESKLAKPDERARRSSDRNAG